MVQLQTSTQSQIPKKTQNHFTKTIHQNYFTKHLTSIFHKPIFCYFYKIHHHSRYPWKNLPDFDCYRLQCKTDRDCCRGYSVCDKSSKTCSDCWFRMGCRSVEDCCEKYPYCKKVKDDDTFGGCADEM
ncbi:hypothetical protein HELRODRAFT_180524 [Helobdella robusta]|uniref:Uncharacterized protein n=1 Tax=Helobdella robusta TaxID=6412 RepID=T1FG05_HELRO|nr:hypothetical protein HELRODRAFT_180524 [Helobdella robusta]ESN93871.1 hypothetical protein HELRODRAFT_180524 [Helobdella robusta]